MAASIEKTPSGTRGTEMPGGKLLQKVLAPLAKMHIGSYRTSGGTDRMSKMMPFPVILLTTKGAKSGAERVVAMSRHADRQEIARQFGATHIVAERGKEGAERIKDMTDGVGADAVLECVGTNDSMLQAFGSARPGSTVGFVGVPHGVELPIRKMFAKNVGLAGGVAPVRTYLPELLDLVTSRTVDPGLVFDARMPLDQVAEGYRAMDERRAIKVYLDV